MFTLLQMLYTRLQLLMLPSRRWCSAEIPLQAFLLLHTHRTTSMLY